MPLFQDAQVKCCKVIYNLTVRKNLFDILIEDATLEKNKKHLQIRNYQ